MAAYDLDGYADGLVEETLLETATTFFGARVALEQEIELHQKAAAELAKVEEGVLRRASALHFLLLGGAAAKEFYSLLGVKPGHLLDAAAIAERDTSDLKIPFALTLPGRYSKLVVKTYEALVHAADIYRHGEYYTDEEGRKRVTVNYDQLQKWCHRLNNEIKALNANHSPTGTMCFVKGLDPTLIEKQRLTEATLQGYAEELDRELAFKPVECIALNYLAAPELPGIDAVRGTIVQFSRALAVTAGADVRRILNDWKSS